MKSVSPKPSRQQSDVSDDSGIGYSDMTQECHDEYAVRSLFRFIKDNLNFEATRDEFLQSGLLDDREMKEYVCKDRGKHYRSERLLKLIIRKKRSKDFVAILHKMRCHMHVSKAILEFQEKSKVSQQLQMGCMQGEPCFTLTGKLLLKHFNFLYKKLEPRDIADELFQTGHIDVNDHDDVADCDRKYKRLKSLLDTIIRKGIYRPFLCVLQSLMYIPVLDTLQNDGELKEGPSDYALCIQHNFMLLQTELPCIMCMEHFLDQSNISDIESCSGAIRKNSKLLKILLMKGESTCEEFLRVLEVDLKKEDLVKTMKKNSEVKKRAGKPEINGYLRCLDASCLIKLEQFLRAELEPLELSDHLFEERAIEILVHDKITEKIKRSKQTTYLLETLIENENNCFYVFLFILKKYRYDKICKAFERHALNTAGQGLIYSESSKHPQPSFSHSFRKIPDDIQNRPVRLRMKVEGQKGELVEQALFDKIRSRDIEVVEETMSLGKMSIEEVFRGSVVLQLRPVTDQAVQTLLSAKDNNRLVEMIYEMLKKIDIAKIMNGGAEPIQIRVQIYYANSSNLKPDSGISRHELIKSRVKAYRDELVSELEPRALYSWLAKSKNLPETDFHKTFGSDERVEMILSMVEMGNSEFIDEFVTALNDLGYGDILELINPCEIHCKAENIRKMITSNYKNILDEMQMSLAKETLTKCIGNVDDIKEKILPNHGNRRQRMNDFLQFVLQNDQNVIEFEKILRNNGLEDMLREDENMQENQTDRQEIEVTVVENNTPLSSDGLLFESVVTLSNTETPSEPQSLEILPDRLDLPVKQNESYSSTSSSSSPLSFVSEAEEEMSISFNRNCQKNRKNVDMALMGHKTRLGLQKDSVLASPPPGKTAFCAEMPKDDECAGSTDIVKQQTAGCVLGIAMDDVAAQIFLLERELREHFRKLGFYREVPTPELLREAQQVYHTLDWPHQYDDDGDPLPSPPSSSRDEILNPSEAQELDEHALQAPTTYLGQHIRYLVEYLIRPAISDVHKARVLTRWLGRCMNDDYLKYLPRTEWSHPESVAGYIWKLRKRHMDYDEFFQIICKYAGLKAHNVDGCVRNTIKYEIGSDFMEQKKSWTAVLLDGNWRLLDVRWICEAAYGVAKTNWRLIEDEKGKVDTTKAIKENRNTFKTQCRFREFYFLTDPEIFIYDHFPDDDKWQLLARKVSYKEAKEVAALRADFFRNKMVLRTHPKCVIESDDGIVKFVIGLQEDSRMSFVYKLYRSKNSKDPIDPSRKELDRYVFMERDSDESVIRVEIRCPAEGEYLFELHGSQNAESYHALLLTYFIRCTGIKGVITPLPPNIRQEWGPGEDTRDMGMVPVTHKKGQVEADDGDAEITFTLEKDLEFKHDLVKGVEDESVTDGHVVHTIENGKMNISLRLPSPGEYALNVMAKEKFKKTRFAPACSYLISCDDEPLQTKPLPNIGGGHIGSNEKFHELGFKEDNAWTSYINNLVTGEFAMQIHKPHDIFVAATLELEEGNKSETFDNYVICDTQDSKVKVTALFPKSGTYKLTLFARVDTVQDENKHIPIYTKIIEVVLPTLAGMPSPIQSSIPDWCHGYHLKEPRSLYLASGEMTKLSISVPEANTIKVKGHPECHLKPNDEGYWEGYLKTGPPRSTVDLMASESPHGQPFKLLSYQVVSKEELLQIEVEQEQLFQRALDELQTLEEEKYARLLVRLKQAANDRNRQKIQKLLYRVKEIKPDKVDVEIVRAERVLRELVEQEEKDIARKELRKATRMSDIPSLEGALLKVKRLKLPEEDGDISAAEEVLQTLRDKRDAALGKTRDKSQQTTDSPAPYFYGNHSGVHIYVMPDGRVQHSEMAPDVSSLHSSRLTRDADVQTLDNSADEEIKEDFTYLAMDSSTPRKTGKTDTSKVPELLRQHLKKRHLMEDEIDAEEIEPSALGALSMIDQEENGDRSYTSRGTGGSRTWKSRAMDVFKKYWHVMKEKSELTRQTLNDDIENEVQRLKHINQMCMKMSRAARRIGLSYNSLIDSEQMFHDILNEPNDQNDSLTEEFCNTSALQQDVITVEEGLKSAFDEFAKSMDNLCAELVTKAEHTARELEKTRLEMATEDLVGYSSKSSLRSDSGVGGSSDRDHPDFVKTSFYAAKNTILEELRSTNATTEEDIRRQLSALQKQMADYHHGNTSSHGGNISGNHSGLFSNSWKY